MKTLAITTVLIASMILSSANVSAADNECKKAARHCNKPKEELLKFSVNDFVGKEDSLTENIGLKEFQATEKPQKSLAEKASSSKRAGK